MAEEKIEKEAPTSGAVGVPTSSSDQSVGESVGKQKIGEITHFFDRISVAIIKLSAPLAVGDKIKIKGATTDLEQSVDTIELDHESLEKGESGQEVGIKVTDKAREGDGVFKA
ncbi:MAG: translation elongation factor-like protein [bacterium]